MQNSFLTCVGSTDRMSSRKFLCIYQNPTCSSSRMHPRLTGWGASWQDRHLSGQWSPQDSNQHINWLELEAIQLAVLQWGPLWINQTARVYCDNSTAVAHIRKQGGTHSISLFNKTLELFHLLDQFGILLIPTHLPGARNVTADALSRLNSPSPTEWQLLQEPLLKLFSALGTPSSGHVRHGREQGDSNLHFTLPGWQGLGGRCPLHIVGWSSICLPSGTHLSQDPPENQGLSGHHSHSDSLPEPVSSVAPPTTTTTQPTSSHSADRRGSLPVRAQHATASVSQGASPVRSSRVAIIRDILKQHDFPDAVIDMAADLLHDSSSHVYNSQWKAFAKWANDKGIPSKDLSYVT